MMNKNQKKIFVVDDFKPGLELIKEILEDEGYIVESADGSQQALAYLKKNSADLCLLDIEMPQMNGFDLCTAIKKIPEHIETPVIFLSGSLSMESKLQGFKVGAVDFVGKPYSQEELLARVTTHLTLRQRELDLQLSIQKTESILRTAPLGIGLVVGGIIREVNYRSTLITGYSKEELVNRDTRFLYLTNEGYKANRELNYREGRTTGIVTHETKWVRKDGKVIDVSISSSLVEPDNRAAGLIYSVSDITEKKENKAKLERSETQFRQMLEANSDLVVISDENNNVTYMNPAAQDVFGESPETVQCSDLLTGKDLKCGDSHLESKSSGEISNREIINKDTGRIYLVSHTQITEAGGGTVRMSIFKDVTDLRKYEAERVRFFNILDQGLNEVFIFNYTLLKFDYANQSALSNLGFSKEEIINFGFFDIYTEISADDFLSKIQPLVNKQQNKLTIQTIQRRKDGSQYPVELTIQIYTEDFGTVLLFNAVDITDKLEKEQTIRKLTQGIEQSSVDVVITDVAGNIEYVSAHFTKATGYKSKDVIGQNPRVLNSGYHSKAFFDNMWKTISSGQVWKGELKNKHRNGTIFWERATITPLKNAKGEIINYIAFKSEITEQKNAERRLAESHFLNREIIKVSQIGFAIYTFGGKLVSRNNRFNQILDISKHAMQKTSLCETEVYKKHGFCEMFLECVKTNTSQILTQDVHTPKGNRKWVNAVFSVLESENNRNLLITIRDISHVRDVEKQLKLSENRLKDLTRVIKQPLFSINSDKLIIEWNAAMERITGYSKSEMLGDKYLTAQIEKKETIFHLIRAAFNGTPLINYEFSFVSKTDKRLTFMLNTSAQLNDDGSISDIICIGQDITARENYKKQLELEVRTRTEELEQALQREKELGLMKSKFVSMASHEFRTPLAAITFASGFVKKYWERISGEERDLKFNKIETQVKHMTSLLDDVLTFGRAESRKITMNLETIACLDFFEPIIEEVESTSKGSHKINFSVCPEDMELYIDPKLGRGIFINLLSNGIKFSPEADKIDFQIEKDEVACVFKIRDYGIGISEADIANIFVPFNRGTNVETIQGTGLGLSIVKESVEMMGGKISVQSTIGSGSCFTVILPSKE